MASQIPNLQELSSQEKKELFKVLETYYEAQISLLKTGILLRNRKGRVFLYTGNPKLLKSLTRIMGAGLYMGTLDEKGRFRPSVEGSRVLQAQNNLVELDEKAFQSYITGENLFVEEVHFPKEHTASFLIVKYKGEYLGAVGNGTEVLTSYLSKGRRLDYNKVF